MTRFAAHDALTQLNNRPALLQPAFVMSTEGSSSMLVAEIARLAKVDAEAEVSSWDERRAHLAAAFGLPTNQMAQKPFAFANGLAIIPIQGLLINRFPYSWGFVTGYNFIRSQLNAALEDDEVTTIIFDVNSPGGACAGCQETAEEIFQARSVKPSLAMVDASCYSAAYWLSSAASKIVLTPSGGAGSIGVLAGRLDITKMMSDFGVEVTFAFAGANKLDMNPMTKFSDAAKERLQASVDSAYADFTSAVARNRDMSVESVVATEASCYDAADALKIGLVDSVAAPSALVESLDAFLNPPDDDDDDDADGSEDENEDPDGPGMQRTETDMSTQTEKTAPSAEQIAADARTAERARISGIRNCKEAADKPKLAAHLAENTDMTVAQAQAILGAAAPEAPQTVATGNEPNHFAAAMDGIRQPDVAGGAAGLGKGAEAGAGAGTTQDEGDTTAANVSSILSAQARATGRKHS